MKTQNEYLAKSSNCPSCDSYNLDYNSLEFDDNQVWQKVYCMDCFAAWNDVYTLDRYELTEEPTV
jgi:hypothetical protein